MLPRTKPFVSHPSQHVLLKFEHPSGWITFEIFFENRFQWKKYFQENVKWVYLFFRFVFLGNKEFFASSFKEFFFLFFFWSGYDWSSGWPRPSPKMSAQRGSNPWPIPPFFWDLDSALPLSHRVNSCRYHLWTGTWFNHPGSKPAGHHFFFFLSFWCNTTNQTLVIQWISSGITGWSMQYEKSGLISLQCSTFRNYDFSSNPKKCSNIVISKKYEAEG